MDEHCGDFGRLEQEKLGNLQVWLLVAGAFAQRTGDNFWEKSGEWTKKAVLLAIITAMVAGSRDKTEVFADNITTAREICVLSLSSFDASVETSLPCNSLPIIKAPARDSKSKRTGAMVVAFSFPQTIWLKV